MLSLRIKLTLIDGRAMFTKEDFKIESVSDLTAFALLVPFLGLIAPFLIAAYTLGFLQDMVGWLD